MFEVDFQFLFVFDWYFPIGFQISGSLVVDDDVSVVVVVVVDVMTSTESSTTADGKFET